MRCTREKISRFLAGAPEVQPNSCCGDAAQRFASCRRPGVCVLLSFKDPEHLTGAVVMQLNALYLACIPDESYLCARSGEEAAENAVMQSKVVIHSMVKK